MSSPQAPEDKTGIDAGTDNSPTTDDSLQPPTEPKKNKSGKKTNDFMDDADTRPEPHRQGANGSTEANAEYRYSSSSTSQPGSRASSGETEYGEGEIEDFPYDDEFENEDKSFVSDLRSGGKGIRSARTSISSLPGSVIVFPNNKPQRNGQFQRGDYRQNIDILDRNSVVDSPFSGNGVRSKKKITKDARYSYIPQVRDMDSPFRHPSSVQAIQMGDEDYYDDGGMDDGNYFSSPASRNGRGHHHGSPRMSDISFRSRPMSPSDQRSYHTSPPQPIRPSKEYALVLLHCTLLPPSFPLSLPPGSPPPSKELLQEILPEVYWTRWKLLEEKIGNTGILRDRGILISHPQEAYDLLEERLLETLGLTRPRLAYGHFIGGGDDTDEDEHSTDDDNNDEEDGCVKEKCQDCGQRLINNRDGLEKKWEVRVYAANGLMGQGAWAAAWKEMEKVDVEVGLCLPTKLRNELERRLTQGETVRKECITEEVKSVNNSHPMTKMPENPPGRLQSHIDGLDEPPQEKATAKLPTRKRERSTPSTPASMQYSGDDINLLKALFNYIRIVCQGNQLPIVTILLVLLALLTPSPYSIFGRSSSNVTSSQPDPLLSAQSSVIPVPSSYTAVVSQPSINSINVVQSSLPAIQKLSTTSSAQSGSVGSASTQLDSSASYSRPQLEETVSTQLEHSPHNEPLSETAVSDSTQSPLPASCYEQQMDTAMSSLPEPSTFSASPGLSDSSASIVQSSSLPPPGPSSYLASSASSALPPAESAEPAEAPEPECLPSSMSQIHAPVSSRAAVPEVEIASEELHESASTPLSVSRSPCPTSTAIGKGTELPFGLTSQEENFQALDADSKPSAEPEAQL